MVTDEKETETLPRQVNKADYVPQNRTMLPLRSMKEVWPNRIQPFSWADIPSCNPFSPPSWTLRSTCSRLLSPSQLVGSLARGDDSLNRIPLATANLASSLPSELRSAANPTERAARTASWLATCIARGISSQWQINISNVRTKQKQL